jgi:flagellar assembly protein FliH
MIHEQALHEGYQAGLAEGRIAAAQVVDTGVERLRTLASSAMIDRAAILRDAERQVLDLALAIARAILHREVALDPTAVTATLDEVLTHLQGEAVTAIKAHPDDVPLLVKLWTERARSAADHEVQIVADHRIAQGGCLIETVTGAWNGMLDTQLERIHQAMRAMNGGGA